MVITKISVPEKESILVFSFIGYQSKEEKVARDQPLSNPQPVLQICRKWWLWRTAKSNERSRCRFRDQCTPSELKIPASNLTNAWPVRLQV